MLGGIEPQKKHSPIGLDFQSARKIGEGNQIESGLKRQATAAKRLDVPLQSRYDIIHKISGPAFCHIARGKAPRPLLLLPPLLPRVLLPLPLTW